MNYKKFNHVYNSIYIIRRFCFLMPFVCLAKNNSNLLTFYIILWIVHYLLVINLYKYMISVCVCGARARAYTRGSKLVNLMVTTQNEYLHIVNLLLLTCIYNVCIF